MFTVQLVEMYWFDCKKKKKKPSNIETAQKVKTLECKNSEANAFQ